MYTLYDYDEQAGKKYFIATYSDAFTAAVEADHVKCDHPKWNVVIEET